MSYSVLLRNQSPKGYRATLLAWPGLVVEARTREDALEKIRTAITEMLTDGEVVELEVPDIHPIISAPYNETFGMFRDDPTFSDFLTEVEQYRMRADENGVVDSDVPS